MYFKECIKSIKSDKIKIFCDMDGVIVDYDVGKPFDYHQKRALKNNIKQLEEVSKMENVELYILSASRMNAGVAQKNMWLDENVPFIKKENRNILPREKYDFKRTSVELKTAFIRNLNSEGAQIVIIDDDCRVLKAMQEEFSNIILYKDTVFVD